MKRTITILTVVVFAVAIVALGAGDPNPAAACKNKAAGTKSASADIAGCQNFAAKAAVKASAGAHECCQNAVSAALASYNAKLESCASAASAKAAGAGSCSYKSRNSSAGAGDIALSDCCKKSVAAFEAAVANYAAAANASGTYSCSSKSAAAKTKTAGSHGCTRSASASVLAAIPYEVGKRVELTGNVLCGHCDLECTDGCQAVFKTADGKAYLLIENERVEKMRSKASENGYKIVTVVRSQDGKKYLDVEKISAL